MFPIIDTKGNVIGFGGRVLDGSLPKYINTADTPVFKKSRNLFSMNFAKTAISGQPKESRRIILAEGYMDVVSIYAAGFENAVATLGTALTQDQAKLLHNCTNQVIIAYDSDSAGRAAAVKAVKILVNEGITPFIINTGGAKDPDEYIKMYGAARFKKLVNSAGDAVLFALDECKEGLDLNTEVEKIECVRRAVKVLADIKDDVSRDIYLTKTAKDLEVSSEMLRAGVKRQTGGEEPVRQAEDYILPKAVPVPQIYGIKTKEQRSQESVIAYLMRNPAAAGELSQKISPDLFTDADCSGIYSVLTERLKISENFTLSLFANELNSTEMGKITEIEINYREISITPDYIEDCIGVLQGMNNLNSAVESDEDLLNLAMRLKSADQYSNFD
jgi:DNA primase